jgi:hypothetical protein
MLEAPKASTRSPTLEGKTMLEALLTKERRRLAVGATTPTHLHPVFHVSKSVSSSIEATVGLRRHLLNVAHISGTTN